MIRWHCYVFLNGEEIMPEFTTVSLKEATLQTSSGRQKRYLNEYIDYITTLAIGQAGKLRTGEEEKHTTIRRCLGVDAKTLGIPLIIKRSGNDLYFWRGDGGEEQPRAKRRYTRRNKRQEETAEQYFSETGELEHEVPAEESPELGQLAAEAERRVAQS
jgi:hypothetical protein